MQSFEETEGEREQSDARDHQGQLCERHRGDVARARSRAATLQIARRCKLAWAAFGIAVSRRRVSVVAHCLNAKTRMPFAATLKRPEKLGIERK